MSTKVKGDKIKEGSIPLSALNSNMKIPSIDKFVKKLSNGDINTTLELSETDKAVLVSNYGDDIRIIKDGESTTYSNYGMTFTISATQQRSSLFLNISGTGSISAFDIHVYKKINKLNKSFLPDDIGGANWNAQQGEAGYIENKPFGISYIGDTHFGDNEWQTYEDVYLYVAKSSHNDAYLSASGYIRLDSDTSHTFDIDGGGGSITVHNSSGFLSIISQDYFDTEEQAAEFLNNVLKVVTFKELDSTFLPNTVIKTTPQTLSDTDKNQALANLGIADLLEALKPVQLSDEPPIGTVTQEQLDEIGLTEKVINNIINGYTNKIRIYDNIYHITSAYTNDRASGFVLSLFTFDADGLSSYSQYIYYKNIDGDITINMEEL